MLAGIRDILIIIRHRILLVFNNCWVTVASGGKSSVQSATESGWSCAGVYYREEFIGGDDCALVLGDNIFYVTTCLS